VNKLNRIQHEALRRVQWCRNDSNGKGPCCPVCDAYENHGHGPHKADCYIGDAIVSFESIGNAQKILTDLLTAEDDRS